MAGGMDLGTGSAKGKKALDTTINLVPFIDLMAVTIVFLIMTAVWTQLGRLQASMSGADDRAPTPEVAEAPIALQIGEKEMRLTVGGSTLEPMPIVRDGKGQLVVDHLIARLTELKAQAPLRSAITLQMDDRLRYDDLVRVIDACISGQFPAVAVSPG